MSAETSSPEVFADRLFRQLCESRIIRTRVRRWERQIQGSVGLAVGEFGIKLTGSAKRPAEEPPSLDVIELLASAGDRGGVVLILDEVTVLCQSLGPMAAVEFLRGLRAERQGHHAVPLVISGSIGLHHALSDTQPINDLWRVEIGPLADSDARELAERLLLGIELPYDEALVSDIVAATSGIPFYIQAVVDRLRGKPGREVSEIVERCIVENDWHTEHYVSRIDDYYGSRLAPVVRALLDEYALAGADGLSLPQLRARLDVALEEPPSRDTLLDLLRRLEADHYLRRGGDGDAMSSSLLARIWRLHRRL